MLASDQLIAVFLGCLKFLARHPYSILVLFPLFEVSLRIKKWKRSKKYRNPTRFRQDEHSIFLRAKRRNLPLNNPCRGTLVIGGAGSGKTKSVLEPMLFEMIKKGYCGIIYDYDFEPELKGSNYSLSHLAYNCFLQFGSKKVRFHSINFDNPAFSDRFNPISPEIARNPQRLINVTSTLLKGLHPDAPNDFWAQNSHALLNGLIVALANKFPSKCTFPHIIAMLTLPDFGRVLRFIKSDKDAAMMAAPALTPYDLGAREQLTGVVATLQAALNKLTTDTLFWVLSGNTFPTPINDPECPIILAIGNKKDESRAVSPFISMLMSVLVPQMYGHGRCKSFVLLDELPTIQVEEIATIVTTARKYGIATVVGVQDTKQLEKRYGNAGSWEVINTFGNLFYGSTSSLSSAKLGSEVLGKKEEESTSITSSEKGGSSTKHVREKERFSPSMLMEQRPGEFCGRVVESNRSVFSKRLLPITAYSSKISYTDMSPLPPVGDVDLAANRARIIGEAELMLFPFSERKKRA